MTVTATFVEHYSTLEFVSKVSAFHREHIFRGRVYPQTEAQARAHGYCNRVKIRCSDAGTGECCVDGGVNGSGMCFHG